MEMSNIQILAFIISSACFGIICILLLVNWLINKRQYIEEQELKRETEERLKHDENYDKLLKEHDEKYNNLLKEHIDKVDKDLNTFKTITKKEFKKPTNIRLFEDKYNPEKYIIKNIELCTDKDFNYFFTYRLIKKYHLKMSVFAMPNPLVLKDKTNMLNPKRFIHAPDVTQIFKPIICKDMPMDAVHYIIRIDRDYNINIGCIIAKFDKLQWQLRNNIPLENYYSKTMSNIYTEMKEFIIECQNEYIEFLTQNGCK